MKIEFKMKVDIYGPSITFMFPANIGYWLGGGEFNVDLSSYPPRLYKVHDWNLKFN